VRSSGSWKDTVRFSALVDGTSTLCDLFRIGLGLLRLRAIPGRRWRAGSGEEGSDELSSDRLSPSESEGVMEMEGETLRERQGDAMARLRRNARSLQNVSWNGEVSRWREDVLSWCDGERWLLRAKCAVWQRAMVATVR